MLRTLVFVLLPVTFLAMACAGGGGQAGREPPSATTEPTTSGPDTDLEEPSDGVLALPEAMSRGLIESEWRGTGGASGDVIRLRVRRTTEREISVDIPLGTVLVNSNPAEQDMVIRDLRGETSGGNRFDPAVSIVLNDDDWHEYVLEAYCLNALRDNPSRTSSLSVADLNDPVVLAVLQAVDEVGQAEGNIVAIQGAVWAVTDNISQEKMRDIGYRFSSSDLDAAAAIVSAAGIDPANFRLFIGYAPRPGASGSTASIIPPTTPSIRHGLIGFNTHVPPLDDVKFRQALIHAVDQIEIVSLLLGAGLIVPSDSIIPRGFPGYDETLENVGSDPGLARQLLSQSRYADPPARPAIELAVPSIRGSFEAEVAQVVAAQWEDVLGVRVTLLSAEFGGFVTDFNAGDHQAFVLLSMPLDFSDTQDFFLSWFHSNGENNTMGYSNLQVDSLLGQANREQDAAARVDLHRQIQELIIADGVWLPLWYGY